MPEQNEGPATHVTADEYDKEIATPAKVVTASEFKLEGDDIPEEFRGKTAAQLVTEAKAFQSALRLSEDARITQRAALESRPAPQQQQQQVVVETELTREQLKTMYDEDPLAAIDAMNNQSLRRAEKHLETRLAGMEAGTAGMAENWARQEFKEEFELFGNDIAALVQSIPNKTPFGTKKGWEDAVSYVRGQKGNFEKLLEHRQNGPSKTAVEARIAQEAAAGFSGGNGTQRGRIPAQGPVVLDDVQKEIAREFINSGTFKDEAEYIRWAKLGGNA